MPIRKSYLSSITSLLSGRCFHPTTLMNLLVFGLCASVTIRRQITDGSIDLRAGDAKALKGPTDVGSAGKKDVEEALSTLVAKLNERFGTRFTEADQLFFDQIRSTAENDERIVEAARNNNLANFSSYLDRMLDEFFIDR